MTLDFIAQNDGMGQTLMFVETLNAGNWASRRTMDIGFVISASCSSFLVIQLVIRRWI